LIKIGVMASCKYSVFRPSEIKEMNFGAGCHDAHPEGNLIIQDFERNTPYTQPVTDDSLMMLHYRNLGMDYFLKRNAYTATRLSAINKKMDWGTFVYCTPQEVMDFFNTNVLPSAIKVL